MDNFAQTPDGLLFAVDGIHRPKRWNSLTATMEDISIAAPTTALVAAVTESPGDILGTYSFYSRFRDADFNYSNLSPVSNTLVAQMTATLTVTAATNAEPIAITTSGAHGLATGNKVRIENVGGNTAANDTWTITVTGGTTFTLDDSEGNAAYTSGGTVTVGVSQINFTSVPVAAATAVGYSKVTAREILRNLDGDDNAFHIDITISDNVTTTGATTNNDTELAANTAVPLLADDGSISANLYGVIPNWKKSIAHHTGRMFLAVDAEYSDGAVIVTNGSPTVTGINTAFTDEMVGRFLYIVGSTAKYEITAVSEANQTLTIISNYAGTTDQYAVYSIKPPPAERLLVYYTVANRPESWPATYAFALQEDGFDMTGLVTKSSFLYIVKTQRTYRFTYRTDPAIDGFSFLAIDRGSINQKCIVPVDATIFMLDQAGIHSFNGSESEPVSQAIQRLFNPEPDDDNSLKINWQAAERFFGVHYPAEETVRFFVCMSGQRYPRHAITYDYRGNAIWIEEYPRPISAACTGTVAGARRMYFGSEGKKVFLHGASKLDGINPNAGVLRGDVTSATACTLTDTTADFPTASLPGLSVSIAEGRGRGQRRIIHSATSTVLSVTTPWLVLPDETSVYQVAGIDWLWESQWFKWINRGESDEQRTVAVAFQPLDEASPAALRIFEDYSDEAKEWGHTLAADRSEGFGSEDGSEYLSLDLSRSLGYAQQRMPDQREENTDGNRVVGLELTGTTNAEQICIYELTVEGVA